MPSMEKNSLILKFLIFFLELEDFRLTGYGVDYSSLP